MFDPTSRYASVADYTVNDDQGRPVTIKKVRFIAPVHAPITRATEQPDRPDLLGFQYYKAPEQFWRIADANLVMDPAELVAQPGQRIKIPPRT
jgi:hypothetical protein